MPRLFFAFVLSFVFAGFTQADAAAPYLDQKLVDQTVAKAAQLPRIHALIVALDGQPVVERVFHGPSLDEPVNIKSASKSIISALIGIAIDEGMIKNVNQPILPLLEKRVPHEMDPKVATITIDHLLSMRAGLERTSGMQNYGRWVQSPNWVSFALTRGFIDEPGGEMLYSTGNTHLLSAILTDASGRSTWELAHDWLGEPLGMTIPQWPRDPQGVYFGGNEMKLSPRDLLRFGEMYRNGGVAGGYQVVPRAWVRASWTVRTIDNLGRGYGYGWFIAQAHGIPVYYAWGFGGQMLYVIPSLKLTVVITSDTNTGSAVDNHLCKLHDLVAMGFMPAVMETPPSSADGPVC
jgi:CubicO group peptidase (beta-lactamase class C family)